MSHFQRSEYLRNICQYRNPRLNATWLSSFLPPVKIFCFISEINILIVACSRHNIFHDTQWSIFSIGPEGLRAGGVSRRCRRERKQDPSNHAMWITVCLAYLQIVLSLQLLCHWVHLPPCILPMTCVVGAFPCLLGSRDTFILWSLLPLKKENGEKMYLYAIESQNIVTNSHSL